MFDACRDELGYDVSDGEGLTSSEIRAVTSLASSYGYTVGHYTNLMYSSTQLVGVGYTTTRYLYRTTSSSNAASLSRYTASYTTDEMRSFITTYQEYLEDYEDSRITEAETLLDELETLVYYLENTEQYTDFEEWIDLYASTAKSYMEDEIDNLISASGEYYSAEDTLEDLEESTESALADYEEALSEYESQLEAVELYEEQLAEKQEEYDTLEAERESAIEAAQEIYDDACEAYTEAARVLEEAEAVLAEAAGSLEAAKENLALAEAKYAEMYDAYTEAYEDYLEAYYARVNYEETANHSYDSGVVTKEATCIETGIKTYTCTVCGVTKTETIAKTDHTYSDTNECTVCGTVKNSKISDATVILSKSSYTYTGSEIKPDVTVTINKTTLVQGTDYTVSYSNNKEAGTATVTVTGKGSYSGTITATFTIKPARAIVKKAKSVAKKKITIKLKKVSGASYYKVQVSKKKKFKKKNIILKKKITKNKKTIKSKKLKRKYKKLYVRARAVAVVSGKKYKGDWSKAKKVKKAK